MANASEFTPWQGPRASLTDIFKESLKDWPALTLPVPRGTPVETLHRDGSITRNAIAGVDTYTEDDVLSSPSALLEATEPYWYATGSGIDIVGYRVRTDG